MLGPLAFVLAVLLKRKLRHTALNVYFRSVISVAAVFAFEPNIFSFCRFGHDALSKKPSSEP